jgi:recombination protein RecT
MGNEMVVAKSDKVQALKAYIAKHREHFDAVAPKGSLFDKALKLTLWAADRTPKLLDADPKSVFRALLYAAQLGLDPSGPLGGVHLVPFSNNKTGRVEVQPIIDYKGLLQLVRRSGACEQIETHVVMAKDTFRCAFGLEPKLEHEPMWTGDRGDVIAAYAIARFKDGSRQVEVMTRGEIDGIRAKVRGSQDPSSPWVTAFAEMARKTVLRRLTKYLPMSTDDLVRKAVYGEEAMEAGEPTPVVEAEFSVLDDEDAKADGHTDAPAAALAAKIGRKRTPKPAEPPKEQPQEGPKQPVPEAQAPTPVHPFRATADEIKACQRAISQAQLNEDNVKALLAKVGWQGKLEDASSSVINGLTQYILDGGAE